MTQPLSYVHPNADIAKNVVIEPCSFIGNDTQIGEGTWVGSNVTIMEGARIGKNCTIFPGSVIAAAPQNLSYNQEKTLAIIGDNTVIREHVTVNRGTKSTGKTVIGPNCMVMAYSHIAHDCVLGKNCILANNSTLAGHITLDDYANLAGLTAIHQFCKIGKHAYVAGGSLVRKDVPPYVKAARTPLSYSGVNSVGLRRCDFTVERIREIQDIYRILYQKSYNVSQAIAIIEAELPATSDRDEILQFIKDSRRGIMRGFNYRHESIKNEFNGNHN